MEASVVYDEVLSERQEWVLGSGESCGGRGPQKGAVGRLGRQIHNYDDVAVRIREDGYEPVSTQRWYLR